MLSRGQGSVAVCVKGLETLLDLIRELRRGPRRMSGADDGPWPSDWQEDEEVEAGGRSRGGRRASRKMADEKILSQCVRVRDGGGSAFAWVAPEPAGEGGKGETRGRKRWVMAGFTCSAGIFVKYSVNRPLPFSRDLPAARGAVSVLRDLVCAPLGPGEKQKKTHDDAARSTSPPLFFMSLRSAFAFAIKSIMRGLHGRL